MMKQKRLLLWMLGFLCLVFQATNSFAQELIRVKGNVTDKAQRSPLGGVTITPVGGSGKAIAADANGNFEISVPLNSRLIITMTGYQPTTVQVKSSLLNVLLETSAKELEDVVVVGYGTVKKEQLTSSIATMKMDEAKRVAPTTSLGNLLAGQLTGVRVSTPTGIPGKQPGIAIRTNTSWNGQNVLYVIDGKISGAGDFNNLSPNDIDNISVLKDAASAAVYGARAAGGVVVVTTRRGSKSQKAQISYSFNTGVDKRGKNAPVTSAIQLADLYNSIYPTGGPLGANFTQADKDAYAKIDNGWGYDQLEEIWNDPSTTSHNLSASGGTENVKYYVGGSYVNQVGMMKSLKYDKYNLRANVTADITKNLTLFTGLTVNNNLTYQPNSTYVGDADGTYRKLKVWQPWQPVWTAGGHPVDYGWIANVGSEARGDGGYVRSNDIKPILNMQLTYKIPQIQGLSASAQFNKSYTNGRTKTFLKRYDMWVMKQLSPFQISTNDADLLSLKKSNPMLDNKDFLREAYSWSNDYQLNFQLNYDHTFAGLHHVKGWLTYEKAESKGGGMNGTRENFPLYLTDQWQFTSGTRADSYVGGSTDFVDGRKSWIGQAFYDYGSKYLASFGYRYDGSMKFPEDKRWGFFPSGSLGWVISKENFFEKVQGIDMLKVRASAGITGNDGIGGWGWQQSYQGGSSAYFGSTPTPNVGLTYGPLTNKNLTWEKTLNYNAGVDANFLKHFTASAEYYFVKTYDILGQRIASVPPTFARNLPQVNYGQINAQGVEGSIGYSNKVGQVNFYVNANASYGNAKYVTIDENVTYPKDKKSDNSTSRVVGLEYDHMIRTQADLDALKAAGYKYYGNDPKLGQLMFKDKSGPDGKPDGIINDWDQVTLRDNNNPIGVGFNLGADWKGLSIDAVFSGNFHQVKWANPLAGGVEWNRIWDKWATDSWTPATPNATLPARFAYNASEYGPNSTNSTFWLKSSSMLRLRALNVGYALPRNLISKAGIQGMKFYFSGSNLFLLSNFNKNYFDPELGDPWVYPTMKTFNFGVNVTL